MAQLIDTAALSALVPPKAVSFALEHREQLSALLASTELGADVAGDKPAAALPMDPTAVEAFRLSYQNAFEEALRQSLPTAPAAGAAPSRPEPEPEPQPQPGTLAKGQPWPTVPRKANWPDSKKPETDDSWTAADGKASVGTGPTGEIKLWYAKTEDRVLRDRRGEPTRPTPNTWGAAEESPEAMLKELLSLEPERLDSRDEHGWTALMWCARLNRQANVAALLQAGATASLKTSKDMWRFPSQTTASQLARLAQEWDGKDRTALCLLLEAAESEEARSRALQTVYDARSEQLKAEHATTKKNAVSAAAKEATADAESEVASKARIRTLLREAETKRIEAEAKVKRLSRDAGTAQAEVQALRSQHERYKAEKEQELTKARQELLEVTAKVRSAELRAAHGLV